jgi:hypothetical protein
LVLLRVGPTLAAIVKHSPWESIALFVSGAVPAVWASSRLVMSPDAAHAIGTIRVVAPGFTGAWRALDVVWANLFMALPIGTRVFRAGLASSFALAAFGIVLFLLARRLLDALSPRTHPLLRAAFAVVGSTLATLMGSAQIEGMSPAGSVLGATIALLPLCVYSTHERAGAFLLGLAFSYEPDVAACALPVLLFARRPSLKTGAAFLAGLLPLTIVLFRSAMPTSVAIDVRMIASPFGEGSAHLVDLRALLSEELGLIVVILATVCIALCALRARRLGGALVLTAMIGLALGRLGAPQGPSRWAPCTLVALGAIAILCSGAIQEIAVQVARVPVPYARASAVMIVVLALAFPFKTADDTSWRVRDRMDATSAWTSDVTFGIAPHACLILSVRPVVELLAALRASGELGRDAIIIAPYDVQGRMATKDILRDPTLTSLARDLFLSGLPQEYALSSLATQRPLFVAYDPRWDRAIARHLVPDGAFDRFMSEPRGQSDRKKALAAFADVRDRLLKATRGDAELKSATTSLLRARALAAGASGDREAVGRTIEDLHRFSQNDATGGEIVKRIVLGKGPVDVADLPP